MANRARTAGGRQPPKRCTLRRFKSLYPGEDETVEFKQGFSADRIAEAVTAFSNTRGGTVLIGVAPDGTPRGTNVDGEARARAQRAVANAHQPGRHTVTTMSVDGVDVLVISVEPRRDGFAQTPDGRLLVRRDAIHHTVPVPG